jgi:cytochrome c biogenesis protein CcmG, thiol:disulfide interchange protein DsbE
MSERINISRVLPVLLFAALAAALAMGLKRDPKVIPSMLLDRPIPQFELPALNAAQPGLNSAKFAGRGLVLVNVFASWCGSCRFEHPFLMRTASDKRFTLVGMDWKDDAQNANKYIDTYGNPYSQIGIDASGRTGIDLGVSGVPETFVIDNQGRVRLRVPGPMTPEIWKAEIEPLIKTAEKAP